MRPGTNPLKYYYRTAITLMMTGSALKYSLALLFSRKVCGYAGCDITSVPWFLLLFDKTCPQFLVGREPQSGIFITFLSKIYCIVQVIQSK
jgi:hypothetical protein